MDALIAMLQNRPPVVANVAAFAVIATAERGGLRTLLWFATGTAIGWLMEFSSIRTGFPFGMYEYHQAAFSRELSAGGVPLFASFSFAALTYFGYSAACTVLSPLHRRARDVQRVDDPRRSTSLRVLALSAVMITWMDLVIDPLTHLGRYWSLGDLYHYDPPGIHFGVPISNYLGWLVTCLAIVGTNQLLDLALRRAGSDATPAFHLPYKPFWAIGSQLGTYVYMVGLTLYLMSASHVPSETPLVGILVSGATLTALYVAFLTYMIRRAFSRGRDGAAQSMIS